jgi:hypothetical protein
MCSFHSFNTTSNRLLALFPGSDLQRSEIMSRWKAKIRPRIWKNVVGNGKKCKVKWCRSISSSNDGRRIKITVKWKRRKETDRWRYQTNWTS